MSDNTTSYDEQYDEWDNVVSSGLLAEYTGTITHSEFATNPQYNDGETVRLSWAIRLDDFDEEEYDQMEVGQILEEEFNVGNTDTVEIVDGGNKVAFADGRKFKFSPNSGSGRIMSACINGKHYGDRNPDGSHHTVGNRNDLVEAVKSRKLPPWDARIWNGLTLRFKRLDLGWTDRKTGEAVDYELVLPVEFVGVDGDVSSDGEGRSEASVQTSSTAPIDKDELAKFAAEKVGEGLSFKQFLTKAMVEFPSVDSDPKLTEYLMDEDEGAYADGRELAEELANA